MAAAALEIDEERLAVDMGPVALFATMGGSPEREVAFPTRSVATAWTTSKVKMAANTEPAACKYVAGAGVGRVQDMRAVARRSTAQIAVEAQEKEPDLADSARSTSADEEEEQAAADRTEELGHTGMIAAGAR
jgi:hypothetical protein